MNENELLTQIRAILEELKAPKGSEAEGVRWLADSFRKAQEAEANLLAEAERLKPLAEDGKTYRADLIEETLKEGVRAMGDNFAHEAYEEMLKSASLARIKEIRDKFAAQAQATIPSGRQTADTDETAGAGAVDLMNFKRKAPESSYSN